MFSNSYEQWHFTGNDAVFWKWLFLKGFTESNDLEVLVWPIHQAAKASWLGWEMWNSLWGLFFHRDKPFRTNSLLKMARPLPNANIFEKKIWTIGRISWILGTRRFLKRFSSALSFDNIYLQCLIILAMRSWVVFVVHLKQIQRVRQLLQL